MEPLQEGEQFGWSWAQDRESGKTVIIAYRGLSYGYLFDAPHPENPPEIPMPYSLEQLVAEINKGQGDFPVGQHMSLNHICMEMLRKRVRSKVIG